MTFQEQLEDMRLRIEGNLAPRFLKILHRSILELTRSGIQQQVLRVGDDAPSFSLIDQNGRTHSSATILQQRNLVLTFYRGFWCPYCNADLAHLKRYREQIENLGGLLLAVSPEKPEYSKKIITMQKINFDILFDQQNDLAGKFGVRYHMSDDLISLYRDSFHYNLKQYHGDDDWTLPMPSRFIIDQNGVIRYAESSPDYRKRPDPEEVIEVLKSITY